MKLPTPLRLVFLSVTMMSASANAGVEQPEAVLLWPDGAPGAKGAEPLDIPKLDIFPADAGDRNGAGVVIFPGGGYGGLAMDHEGRQIARFYNSFGVTAFVCTYRLGTSGYHHPTQLNDAKRAVRWARAHAAKYGVDPSRLGVTGFSAGGHLASTVGTLFDSGDPNAADPVDRISSRPDYLVLAYAVISMSDNYMHRGSRNNLLGPDKDNEETARQVSNHRNVSPHTPPAFIFQTDEDSVVPAENSVNFYLALRKHKVPAEMHIYRRGPHGVGLMHGDPVLSTWGGLLQKWLRNEGWLAKVKRAAVEGTVSVNGTPVAWGAVTFTPEDANAPEITARVMNGRFSLPGRDGPPLGKHSLAVTWTSAAVPALTTKEAPEGVMLSTRQGPGLAEELTWEVKDGPGANKLVLDLKW
jgi:acetyl esterase/lipase